ncbi:Crp/Fnr family transcriptional regulator [Actinomadura atramentaria]|uniref:Crp/Fnr family transcriptional regulator n=1 Tax=Actinomadura atramentaria TaxID=1990 RepID=UPI000361FFC6|nr:Crp/Fnr family transcriptional regulator [Actinomadura atramentaria]
MTDISAVDRDPPRAVPFWTALDEPRRAALRAAGRSRPYPARAPLCVQGDASDHVVVVESGWAKVTSATADGRDVVLAVRGPGDLVCESAVLGSRERSATVTALGPLRGLVVPAGRFTAFLDANPALWRLVSGTVVGRLDAADRRVRAQASARGPQRLALLLAELAALSEASEPSAAGPRARPPGGAVTIAPPLSQEELGSWMDASRETVARALNELRRRGLVETGWRRITVLDPGRLRAFAHPGP